jgi:signal peptidase I
LPIILSTLSNLILLGSGLLFVGQKKAAITIVSLLFLAVYALCWTRFVFEPVAIILFVAFAISLIVISTILTIRASTHRRNALSFQQIILYLLFFLLILLLTFGFKHKLLGVEVNYVPSPSMEPTLKPGQIILSDTWAYEDKSPEIGDVVTFEHGVKHKTFVKRINFWPNGDIENNGLWFVTGDNAKLSQDSRYFGGIESKQLIGKVRLILFNLNSNQKIKPNNFLIPVQ